MGDHRYSSSGGGQRQRRYQPHSAGRHLGFSGAGQQHPNGGGPYQHHSHSPYRTEFHDRMPLEMRKRPRRSSDDRITPEYRGSSPVQQPCVDPYMGRPPPQVQDERVNAAAAAAASAAVAPTALRLPPQTIVRLNVGGQRYMTTVATLTRYKDTLFEALFEVSGASLDDEGAFFFDRDGTFFMLILNFMRDGGIDLPSESTVLKPLLREAQFYRLTSLVDQIQESLETTKDSVAATTSHVSPISSGGGNSKSEDDYPDDYDDDDDSNHSREQSLPRQTESRNYVESGHTPAPLEPLTSRKISGTRLLAAHTLADPSWQHKIVTCVDFDPEGEYFAASMISSRISIFRLSSFIATAPGTKLESRTMSPNKKTNTISWSRSSQTQLVHGDYDGNVCLWDTNKLEPVLNFDGHKKRIWCVSFASAAHGKQFASGADDKLVQLWTTDEKKPTATVPCRASICCVRFSPDDNVLSFSTADHNAYCYDMRNLSHPLFVLQSHTRPVWALSFLNDRDLVSASVDSTIKKWDIKDGRLLMTYGGHINKKNFTGLSTGQGYVACGSEDNKVYLWHADSPDPIATHAFSDVPESKFVSTVCWKPGSNMIVAGNQGGSVNVFQATCD